MRIWVSGLTNKLASWTRARLLVRPKKVSEHLSHHNRAADTVVTKGTKPFFRFNPSLDGGIAVMTVKKMCEGMAEVEAVNDGKPRIMES